MMQHDDLDLLMLYERPLVQRLREKGDDLQRCGGKRMFSRGLKQKQNKMKKNDGLGGKRKLSREVKNILYRYRGGKKKDFIDLKEEEHSSQTEMK